MFNLAARIVMPWSAIVAFSSVFLLYYHHYLTLLLTILLVVILVILVNIGYIWLYWQKQKTQFEDDDACNDGNCES